jgi:hypothetical protein
MQSHYPASFEREMGCTEAEWLQWLPRAVGGHALTLGQGSARVAIGGGTLSLSWQALAPRRIALIEMPRVALAVCFDAGVGEEARQRFMRYFDLCMQRGGG